MVQIANKRQNYQLDKMLGFDNKEHLWDIYSYIARAFCTPQACGWHIRLELHWLLVRFGSNRQLFCWAVSSNSQYTQCPHTAELYLTTANAHNVYTLLSCISQQSMHTTSTHAYTTTHWGLELNYHNQIKFFFFFFLNNFWNNFWNNFISTRHDTGYICYIGI